MTYKDRINMRYKEIFETVCRKKKVAYYHNDEAGRELFVTKGKESFRMFWMREKNPGKWEADEILKALDVKAVAVYLEALGAELFEEVEAVKFDSFKAL